MFEKVKGALAKAGAVTALAVSSVGSAMAAPDPTITAAITEAGATMVGYATSVVGIMVGVWAVKRSGQKMGWW